MSASLPALCKLQPVLNLPLLLNTLPLAVEDPNSGAKQVRTPEGHPIFNINLDMQGLTFSPIHNEHQVQYRSFTSQTGNFIGKFIRKLPHRFIIEDRIVAEYLNQERETYYVLPFPARNSNTGMLSVFNHRDSTFQRRYITYLDELLRPTPKVQLYIEVYDKGLIA
jgi:hypothetical protein